MDTYTLTKIVLFVLYTIYGIVMFACPKACLKKEHKEDKEKITKMRRGGLLVLIVGVAVLVIQVVLMRM